jgi:hypothetical protein
LSAVHQQTATFVDVARQWLACAFRRFASLFFGGGESNFLKWRRGGEQSSGAEASRERFFTSSLPGLTRQSMRGAHLLRLTVLFDSLHVSMDHRVKPGGDDRENEPACASLRAQRSNPAGLRGKLDCFVAVAPRNDEWSEKHDKVPPVRGVKL